MVNFKSSGFDKGTGGKSGKFQFDCDGRLSKKSFVAFVARGQPLRGQTRLAPFAKRSTCGKSTVMIAFYLRVVA